MTFPYKLSQERKTIGVFVSRLGQMWSPEFIEGITDAAEVHDLNVICFVGGKPTSLITPGVSQPSFGLYDIARTQQLAGIIVSGDLGYELNSNEIQLFFENYAHLPFIVNALQVNGYPNLIADNLHGMRAVVSHLLDVHVYRRIAFIRGPENQFESEQRLFAYKQELIAHDLPFDPEYVIPGDFTVESGRAAIRILLDERKLKVDAIVAANDRMAIGAYEALQLRGIQVPGSIALTGFDDIRDSRALGVPLTTVRQSFHDMGTQAVDLLLRRIGGESLPETIIQPTQLVIRWSCGCLPESVQSAAGITPSPIRIGLIADRRDEIIASLLQAMELQPGSPPAQAFKEAAQLAWEALLQALQDEQKSSAFLHSFEALFSSLEFYRQDVAAWHNLLSTLRQQILNGMLDPNRIRHAENLFQQARTLTGELFQRQRAHIRLRLDQQEEILQAFSSSIAPAMSLDEIGFALTRHFPDLGIERLYVMLYSSMATPQSTLVPPSENYHLLMQYDEQGFQTPIEHPKWATGYLIPRGKTPENRRYSAVVMPLVLAQNRFGFVWIEMSVREWEVYVRIRNLISSALLRTSLVDQRSRMQKQVEHLLQESQLRELELAIATERAEKTAEDNARLYANEQERRKGAENLSKVARSLSTLLKMDELPQQILIELAQLVPYERGALLMESTEGGTHIMAHAGFPENAPVDGLLLQIKNGAAYANIMHNGEPVILDDITVSENWQAVGVDTGSRGVDWLTVNHSWMGVPLFSKGKVMGMLSITRADINAFSQDELLLVTTFGMQAAISLENAHLYDELTRFSESLERLVAQRVEELNIAYNKLEKLDKNKTSFIQVTAHELRTPLTVMKGYLGMLMGTPAIQENVSLVQAVDGVLKGTDRLHLIVNSMLDVARLEGQMLTPRPETVVIGLVLQLIHKEYKQDLANRNIRIQFDDGLNTLPFIQADPELLGKALDAIFVNAIKYTPDGGLIRVGGRVLQDKQLGSCLEIYIKDTGIGIDPAYHQVIFEKLFQLGKVELHSSGRTKFKGGGSGLGLAIAAAVIKAHNGKLWVESPGYNEQTYPGSTFFIRLPLPQNN